MYREEFDAASNAARAKSALLRSNPLGYFILSMLAGAYIGFGVLLTFSVGGMMNGASFAKVIMGLTFGIALSLVVIAGAELFTGNNLVMAAGCMKKTVTPGETIKLWIVCYLGNLAGSMLLAFVYHLTGLGSGAVGEFMAAGALGKMTAPALQLFARGILCNTLVCLAVWSGFRCKSDSGKLIMIFWCLFAFITTGFEHSIANMTLFTVVMLNPCGQAVTIGGYVFNLLFVTLGNMVGGIVCVAVPYFLASRNK